MVIHDHVSDEENYKNILIVCPTCRGQKILQIPKKILDKNKGLTTVSIPANLICEHSFQAFVDKNFMVRGYQKVDFECASELIKSKKLSQKDGNGKDKEFSEYIIIEENYLAYKPKENQIIIERKYNNNDIKKAFENKANSVDIKSTLLKRNTKKLIDENSKMNLEDIYDEFWDFIDENNKDFQEFIQNDHRRENSTINF